MPRTARASVGGVCYHVLNRGNGRAEVFHKEDDYAAFLKLLCQASECVPMRLLAYCLMPNHFYLVNEPQTAAELAAMRESVNRGSPFGSTDWKCETAKRLGLGLESSLRPQGRPRKNLTK